MSEQSGRTGRASDRQEPHGDGEARRSLAWGAAPGRRVSDMHGRPTVAELVEAVREFLEHDVMAATEGRVQFHTRVAINVLGMVQRELEDGPAMAAAHAERDSPRSGSRTRPRWRPRSARAASTTATTRSRQPCGTP